MPRQPSKQKNTKPPFPTSKNSYFQGEYIKTKSWFSLGFSKQGIQIVETETIFYLTLICYSIKSIPMPSGFFPKRNSTDMSPFLRVFLTLMPTAFSETCAIVECVHDSSILHLSQSVYTRKLARRKAYRGEVNWRVISPQQD